MPTDSFPSAHNHRCHQFVLLWKTVCSLSVTCVCRSCAARSYPAGWTAWRTCPPASPSSSAPSPRSGWRPWPCRTPSCTKVILRTTSLARPPPPPHIHTSLSSSPGDDTALTSCRLNCRWAASVWFRLSDQHPGLGLVGLHSSGLLFVFSVVILWQRCFVLVYSFEIVHIEMQLTFGHSTAQLLFFYHSWSLLGPDVSGVTDSDGWSIFVKSSPS